MALELASLVFKTETSDLERASKAIGELVTNVGKLDKAARDAAQTEVVLAKAAKLNADANLQNAKAQDVRLKSTIAADKADQQATAAIEKKTKATEKVNEVVNKNVGVLQRQKDILEFQTQGFSKGQSSILAYAKAAGLAAEDIGELGKVLETQRKLMGGDPFDKSLSGLKSLQNQYTELKESVRQYATDSNLTAKQTRELARDKERLIEKMKVEGASFSEIRKAVRAHNAEYVNLATSYNKMASAEDAVIKSRKEAVNATNYLTQADQRMAAALNTSNAALDKAGTDSLVKYETALRKSGISQDVATAKLAKYKAQLEQVQIQEQKRREQHLAKALAPQATDVVVSLWSGQNPLTVLLQQGGQVTDLFMQSGVAAEKFGEVVKSSMKSMLPSILNVVKGIGGLLVDGLTSAGNAVLGFVGKVTGMSGAIDGANKKLMDMGWTIAAAGVRGLGILMTTVFAAGAGAVVAGLVAIGVALKQAISENDKMAVSLGLTGAAMGLTFATATDLSKSMQGIGVSTSDAMKVLSEMAKQGKLTSEDVMLVTKAAVDMNTYAGVAIEDTVKQFVKMKEKPVEAMLELAKATGLVAPEVVKAVIELEDQGKTAEATSKAIEELARVNDEQVARMKESYNGFSLFMIDLGKGISKFFSDAFKDLFYAASPTEQLKTQLKAVDETLNNWGTMNMDAVGAIQMLIPGEKERLQLQRTQLLNQIALLDQEKQQYEVIQKEKQDKIAMLGLEKSVSDELAKRDLKRSKKKDNLQDFTANFIEEKVKEVAKSSNLDIETIKSNDALMESYKKLAQVEWETQKKPKPDRQAIKDLETEIDLRNKDLGLLASFNNELDAIERRRAKTGDEDQYQASLNALIEKQPIYLERQKEINAAHDLANKLTGKADMLGKDYYKTLEQIQEFQDSGLYSTEKVETLRKAAYSQTELAKQQLKYIEESTKLRIQYSEESKKSLDASSLENQKLDDRVALLGLTSEQQKYLKIQQQQRNSLLGVDLKLSTQIAKIWEDVRQGKLDPFDAMAAQLEAEKAAAEERKTINREVVVQAAEDYDAEFKKIKSTVSESITAALFDGGKAGSSKIKDYLKTELRKRITISIDAFINPIMGTVAGALGFGGGSSASASNGGGAFSALNGGIASGISNAFSKFAGSSVGQSLGLSNSTAIVGNNPSAYVPEGGQLTSLGQNIGSVAGMIGSGLAGYGISSAISGGYTTGGNTVNALSGIASAFLGPLAGVIGGLVNRAFGRKLADSGIQGSFGTQSGFSGESYQFYKGGWFRSDKTKTSELDASIAKTLGTAFTQMITQVGTLGTVLGLSTDRLKDFNTTFKISFQGLQEEEIQGKIQEALATANNEMAEQILGTWSKTTKEVTDVIEWRSGTGEGEFVSTFENITRVVEEVSYTASSFAREGEKAIDTLTRLATSITLVNSTFEGLGYSLYEASLQGGDFASKLIDLFGGNDNFAALTTSYYENFYSEQEKTALLTKQLTKEFGKFNEAIPTTKAEFKAIVDKQDLLTDSGRESFAKLLGLQTPLLNLFDLLEKAAADAANSVKELSSSVIDEINRLRGYTDTSGNSPQALIAEFDRLTTLARGGDANAFNSLGDTSKLLDEYYKNTATSAVQYAYQRSVLANSLEQSYNTAKASGATFSGTSSLMGTPALSAPVVSSVSSANAAGSSGLAGLLTDLITEVSMLRAEVRADVAHNAKTAKILERVTPEGDALATRNEG